MKHLRKLFLIVVMILFVLSCSNENKSLFNTYLEINLSDPVIINPFVKQPSMFEYIKVIEKARHDNNIKGIILNIGSVNRTRDNLWELRCAIENFKSEGKKVVAYINNADIDIYLLASAADKIVMDEMGQLVILGYSSNMIYFSQALEKIGIGVQELRYFDYKTAAEGFTRTNMSEADRTQNENYLDDIFSLTRSALMKDRGWSLDEFNSLINNDFMHSASSAKERGLVDYTGGFTAVQNAVSEIEDGKFINYKLYGDSGTSLTDNNSVISGLNKYNASEKRGTAIAVVYANGETDMTRGMEIAKLAKTIIALGDDARIKAIVVRVNSPGGSAQASEYFSEALNYAKERKPVVVSMGQLAASGGYWVSLPADYIVANPYSLTGSIGVISTWFYDNGLYDKIGLNTDVIKRGEHSDLYSGFIIPYRSLSAQEEEQFKKMILEIYDIFMNKVAVARNMELELVAELAQGRIYSGTRAYDIGLVDSVGTLFDALEKARELADIPEDAVVNYREYPEPTFIDILLGNLSVRTQTNSIIDILINEAELKYRLENNGKVLPIMPLEFSVK